MRVTISGQADMPALPNDTAVIVALDPGTHLSEGSRRLAEHDGPRLHLHLHDVWFDSEHHVLPDDGHLAAVATFLDAHYPVHLHVACLAGVNCSAALALFAVAQVHPELPDDDVVRRIMEARPQCFPNPLIVNLIDRRLGRELTAALERVFESNPVP